MKKQLILSIIALLFVGDLFSQNGYVTWSNSFAHKRTEWYIPMTPTNNDGNRQAIGWIKDSTMFFMGSDTIKFGILSGTGERFVTAMPNGSLNYKSYYQIIDTSKLATKYFVNSNYQLKGSYLSISDTASMLSPYLKKSIANTLYQPIGSYITNEVDPTVPSYSKSLTAFSVIKTSTDLLYEPLFTKNTAFNSNYGTTAGTTAEGNDSRIVNGQTAYNWGNHALVGYQTTSNMQNNLTSSSTKYPTVDAVNTGLNTKQATLVSGTNIKTINGSTLLGSGDISTNQTLNISGNSLSISGGNSVTLPSNAPSISTPSRSLNTNFTVTTTTIAFYSIKITNGVALIAATSGTAYLEYSIDGGATWVTASQCHREESGLSLLNINAKASTFVLTGTIPSGATARIRTSVSNSGTAISLESIQEIKF